MSTATEPRSAIVLLEPKEKPIFEIEREALINASQQFPATIETPEDYTAVAEYEARIDRFIDTAAPLFDQHCAEAHKVWKSACAIRSAFLDVPKALKAGARQLLSDFKQREARHRRELEQREAERQLAEESARIVREAVLLE